jgi:oligosaccharide reducing-end xylanase
VKRCLLAVLLTAWIGGFAPSSPGQAGAGEFATGNYRNLFLENGHAQEQIDQKVDGAFQQLFHGDPQGQAVYFSAGQNSNGPLAYICDVNSGDVRTEGMSYGMMIAVQLNKRAEFDALWNWAQTHMYHPSPTSPAYGFFSWSMKSSGAPNDEMPASDGEEYFAMSLYFAQARWGNGSGIYQYGAEAAHLLSNMLHRRFITGRTVAGEMTAGALFDEDHFMVRFTPDKVNCNHTDPSYQLPAFYELWARWGPAEDRDFWAKAAAASRDFFPATTDPTTGLAPDYAEFDGTPWRARWSPKSVDFRYDAWRTAMNWSVDWAWWRADPRETQLSNRLQQFFLSRGIYTYGNQYERDGVQLGTEHSVGLVSMNAVASLAANNPAAQQFVEALWRTAPPTGQYRYYDGMLYLLAMLHCSGEFKIWTPSN